MNTRIDEPGRHYLPSKLDRLRQFLRVHFNRAVLGGISSSAVVAGFLDATGVTWPLLGYIGLATGITGGILGVQCVASPRMRYLLLLPLRSTSRSKINYPQQLALAVGSTNSPVRQIEAARFPDPVYGGGLRVLCGASNPMIIVSSNRRDVSKPHELLYSIFSSGRRHTHVDVDTSQADVPIPRFRFERELPEGCQDSDHTLAIKDLVYIPELASALTCVGASASAPILWPEHCVDPAQLAERDLIIVGGPDTNFWHAALFEPIVQEFERPKSSVPLALDLRDNTGRFSTYGSRVLTVRLAGLKSVFTHTRDEVVELDERLFPTYGMLMACRNPYAAAINLSRWCVFVAGTRSLGTSGGVLALTMMLDTMQRDSTKNYFSEVPITASGVRARVSAVLYRTTEVEQSMLRRGGEVLPRQRRHMSPEGADPNYSDTYIPTAVEYLSYDAGEPRWHLLGSTDKMHTDSC